MGPMDNQTAAAPDETTALVLRVQSGDRDAFVALTRLYQKQVFILAYSFVHDKEDALDLVQETFLKLYQKIGTYRPGHPFAAWLRQIARNLCIDHYRKHTLRRRDHESGKTVEELDLPDGRGSAGERDRDLKDILSRCVDRLAERQKTIFILRHYNQLRNEDIAATLGISLGTVKSLHFKAVRNLRALMGPYLGWEA